MQQCRYSDADLWVQNFRHRKSVSLPPASPGSTTWPQASGHGQVTGPKSLLMDAAGPIGRLLPTRLFGDPEMQHSRDLGSVLASHIQPLDPTCASLISWIPYFDLELRKLVLTVCQLGIGAGYPPWLRATNSIYHLHQPSRQGSTLLKADFIFYCDYITTSVILRSLFSIIVRAEVFLTTSPNSREMAYETIAKEITGTFPRS